MSPDTVRSPPSHPLRISLHQEIPESVNHNYPISPKIRDYHLCDS
ncbi:hypothetical protein [Nostoc sp.]